jgi:hypothetical protein
LLATKSRLVLSKTASNAKVIVFIIYEFTNFHKTNLIASCCIDGPDEPFRGSSGQLGIRLGVCKRYGLIQDELTSLAHVEHYHKGKV